MVDTTGSATEEAGSTPISSELADSKQAPRSFLNSARRNLSEQELKAPGAIRLLISESDRLEARCSELEIVATAYHDLRVDHAALKEKNKKSTLTEILVTLAIGTGSIGLALGQRLLSVDGAHETGYAMMIGAALLIVAALVTKAWK